MFRFFSYQSFKGKSDSNEQHIGNDAWKTSLKFVQKANGCVKLVKVFIFDDKVQVE